MTAFFPLEAQQEVWDDIRTTCSPSPTCRRRRSRWSTAASRSPASWPWASGVDSAAWLILSALIPGKDGPPTLAWCLVPVSDVVVDHDSWNVCGLQGTGSKTVVVTEPMFVPKHRILPVERDLFRQGSGSGSAGQRSRRASAIRLSGRLRWSRRSSAWRKARSTPSPRRRAAPSAWRGPACSRRSPNRR